MSRRALIAGNWKMNLLRDDVEGFAQALGEHLGKPELDVLLFPSPPLLETAARSLGGLPVGIGGQDLHAEEGGAFTGDTSGAQLRDLGCDWVLCGHSERRSSHGETDELIARKLTRALASGLQPILCVGETAQERNLRQTELVLRRQLLSAWPGELPKELEVVIAYEPVWAIGTGETATPALAQEAHAFLRHCLREASGPESASRIRILYGGSVKPANCRDLYDQADVDGFLIGGASLDPGSFLDIIGACVRAP